MLTHRIKIRNNGFLTANLALESGDESPTGSIFDSKKFGPNFSKRTGTDVGMTKIQMQSR
jgi:hypothetical protein